MDFSSSLDGNNQFHAFLARLFDRAHEAWDADAKEVSFFEAVESKLRAERKKKIAWSIVQKVDWWMQAGNLETPWHLIGQSCLLSKLACEEAPHFGMGREAAQSWIHARNARGQTPLHMAMRADVLCPEWVGLLLEWGADPLALDHEQRTPIENLSTNFSVHFLQHQQLVHMLLDAIGQSQDTTSFLRSYRTMHVALHTLSIRLLSMIVKTHPNDFPMAGSELYGSMYQHGQLRHFSSLPRERQRAFVRFVEAALDLGMVHVNARMGRNNDTLLHLATSYGMADVVDVALRHGADITLLNNDHRTFACPSSLGHATAEDYCAVLEVLARHRVDVRSLGALSAYGKEDAFHAWGAVSRDAATKVASMREALELEEAVQSVDIKDGFMKRKM